MPNTRISDLTAAASVAGTDAYPSVQTAGVGPVKTSLTQITAFALANAPAGAVATPSIAPTGDPNTGFWFPAADTIAASTGGSERLRINSSGNVGIGTTSPNAAVDIANGNEALRINADFALFRGYGADKTTSVGFLQFNKSADVILSAEQSIPLVFKTNATEKMRITSAGNVGIGTASPSRRLEVHGTPSTIGGDATGMLVSVVNNNTAFNASPTSGISLWNRFNTAGDAFPSAAIQGGKENTTDGNYAGYMSFFTIGAAGGVFERMRINSAGDVGIGTTSPSGALNVYRNTNGNATVRLENASNGSSAYANFQVRNDAGNNVEFGMQSSTRSTTYPANEGWIYASNSVNIGYAGSTKFYAGSFERMRIDSAGNVLIGTTSSPTTGTQCLTIETDAAPTATPADTVTFYSSDLSAGNTMPSFYTEGTIVGTGTPTADRTIAVRINGTVYYLLASTIP